MATRSLIRSLNNLDDLRDFRLIGPWRLKSGPANKATLVFFEIGALKQNEALENVIEEIVEYRVIGADVVARAGGWQSMWWIGALSKLPPHISFSIEI